MKHSDQKMKNESKRFKKQKMMFVDVCSGTRKSSELWLGTKEKWTNKTHQESKETEKLKGGKPEEIEEK